MNIGQHLQGPAAPLRAYLGTATAAARGRLTTDGAFDAALAQERQRELHGLAWITTTAEAVLAG